MSSRKTNIPKLSEKEMALPDEAMDLNFNSEMELPREVNLLPLREVVIFPALVAPLGIGRESSVQLVHESLKDGNRIIGVACMKDPSIDQPGLEDVYQIGSLVAVRVMSQVTEGIRLMVQGIKRFKIVKVIKKEPYLRVRIRILQEPKIPISQTMEIEALKRNISQMFQRIVQLSPDLPDEMQGLTANVTDPYALTDLIAAQMPRLSYQERQEILEILPLKPRMHRLMELLAREMQVMELGNRLQSEVAQEMGKTQREYYLREHMRQIQKELGEGDDRSQDIDELREQINASGMPEEARKEADRELERLSRMNPAVPEYNVART